MTNHASTRTTQLYDRRRDDVSLDDVERIVIWGDTENPMGEARRKRTLLDQLRAEQPYCIYCGGRTLGDSVDHMPPRTIFDLRYRPKGLEFLACTACNEGAKKAEQIAGFLSRLLYPTPRTYEID